LKTKKKTTITTEKDFRLFADSFYYWMDMLGMGDWKCYFFHRKIASLAMAQFDAVGRGVSITFSTDWGAVEATPDMLNQVAFHEACEVLLSQLRTMSNNRTAIPIETDEAVHVVIRRLENLVFRKFLPHISFEYDRNKAKT